MEFDLNEEMEDFRCTARNVADRMIAHAESFGINPKDPWGSHSLHSVAERYLAPNDDFSSRDLAIFLGEGMVRQLGGRWSASVVSGTSRDKLEIVVKIYVEKAAGGGTFPDGVVAALEKERDPEVLTAFIDWGS